MFLALIWGSSFILIKKGLIAFSAGQVGTLRIFFAYIIILPVAVKSFKTTFRKRWKAFLIFGLISNFIPAVLFAFAETGLSSSLAGILNALTPIFTLIIGAFAFNIVINKPQAIGLLVGFGGSVMLTFVQEGGHLGSFNYFALFVIAATICYGIAGNLVKSNFMDVNPVVLTSLGLFSVGPISIIYLLASGFFNTMETADHAWASLGYIFILGVVGTAIALFLFNRVIQSTTPVFASAVTYLIPITAVFWGFLDGEGIYSFHFIGMVLIILGVYIINKNK